MAHLSSVSGKNVAHLSSVRRKNMAHEEGQQHPIKLYLVIWGWLFVLSTCSYLVDFFGIHGYLRWSLILLFMIVKAGLIVAVFMHMAWERLGLRAAGPDVCHSGPAEGGVAVCGNHGVRVGLHALHSARILRNGGR